MRGSADGAHNQRCPKVVQLPTCTSLALRSTWRLAASFSTVARSFCLLQGKHGCDGHGVNGQYLGTH